LQDEAHGSAVKLQRFSLESSNVHDKLLFLQRENALFKSELDILRANPLPSIDSEGKIQEVNLFLRQMGDKLASSEEALLQRTTELADAQSEIAKAKLSQDNAYKLAARSKGLEQEGSARQRELELQVKELQEQMKMSDLALKQYADLVRNLEGRPSKTPPSPVFKSHKVNGSASSIHSFSSATTLTNGLVETRADLQKLVSEFSSETQQLHGEIASLQQKLVEAELTVEAEKQNAENDRVLRAKAQFELEKLRRDDNTASKMVARYMYVLNSVRMETPF
jgi:chromosome segregation ATPase